MALARGCRAEQPVGADRGSGRRVPCQHEREYNFRRDDAPVDMFRLNLQAVGVVPKAELASTPKTAVMPAAVRHRPVWFDGR